MDWFEQFRAAMFAYHALLEVADMDNDSFARDAGYHLSGEIDLLEDECLSADRLSAAKAELRHQWHGRDEEALFSWLRNEIPEKYPYLSCVLDFI
ncbi:MAG: hypothetical protein AAF635_12595 [Cyanobacteria bacterium P01_C01_bin.69]